MSPGSAVCWADRVSQSACGLVSSTRICPIPEESVRAVRLPKLSVEIIDDTVRRALREDLPWGDVTTDALIPDHLSCTAYYVAKQAGVLAGLDLAAAAMLAVDSDLVFAGRIADGGEFIGGAVVASVEGEVRSILRAERVSLNFLQRLSGVATLTREYVEAVGGTKAKIVDTRKTTPGLRVLEKYAVRAGGGQNHRFGLSDGVLIKDNHLAAMRGLGKDLGEIVAIARAGAPHTIKIEVEVESVAEAVESAEAGADIVLLDNMSPEQMRRAVEEVAGRAILEASGEVTLENAGAIAKTGVDLISIGKLTHSAPAVDISLDVELRAGAR